MKRLASIFALAVSAIALFSPTPAHAEVDGCQTYISGQYGGAQCTQSSTGFFIAKVTCAEKTYPIRTKTVWGNRAPEGMKSVGNCGSGWQATNVTVREIY
jgi:hypothetical protein